MPRVRAVSRAVSILRAFTSQKPYLALNEIVRSTGLDAGTTRRILVTLKDEGLVHQDSVSGLYSASTGLLQLSRAVPASVNLLSLVEPHLVNLAESTQTTVYLSVVHQDEALCLARKNGGQAIEVRWWMENETRAFNLGTGPRVLLAHLGKADQERIMSEQLALIGSEQDQLRSELDAILADGFISKHDEIAVGISAMAVPLLDDEGGLLAAISTGGLTPQYIGAAKVNMLNAMQATVSDMQNAVRGYRA